MGFAEKYRPEGVNTLHLEAKKLSLSRTSLLHRELESYLQTTNLLSEFIQVM